MSCHHPSQHVCAVPPQGCHILYMPMATSTTFEQICAMVLASSALALLTVICERLQISCRSLFAIYVHLTWLCFLPLPCGLQVSRCTGGVGCCEQCLVFSMLSKQDIVARKCIASHHMEGQSSDVVSRSLTHHVAGCSLY